MFNKGWTGFGAWGLLLSACVPAGRLSDPESADEPMQETKAEEDKVDETAADLPLGPDDLFARTACEGLGTAPQDMVKVVAATDVNSTELKNARLSLNHKAYVIELPQNAEGWVRLDEFHWESTLAFFAPVGTEFELADTKFEQVFDRPTKNGACPEKNLLDYRAYFDSWSNANVRFPAQKRRTVKLLMYIDETIKQKPTAAK